MLVRKALLIVQRSLQINPFGSRSLSLDRIAQGSPLLHRFLLQSAILFPAQRKISFRRLGSLRRSSEVRIKPHHSFDRQARKKKIHLLLQTNLRLEICIPRLGISAMIEHTVRLLVVSVA